VTTDKLAGVAAIVKKISRISALEIWQPYFSVTQNIWPWMTLTGYLALNSVFAPIWLA